MKKLGLLPLAIAVFAMFFGAGNIVFPLIIGRKAGSAIPYAMLGFILTAVVVPIIGFVGTILFKGDYDKFFFKIGKIPALLVIALCMLIIGPLGASRCVIISYSAIQNYIPFSLFYYTLIVALIVFILAIRENKVVAILGRFLGPVKIILLLTIIVLVMITFHKIPSTNVSMSAGLFSGLKEGYFTLDLIGSFFFSHLIYTTMAEQHKTSSARKIALLGVKAGILGGVFLAIIYGGFGLVSALHGPSLANILPEDLFSTLATQILGPYGSILANLTVAIATITTAIALTTVFADYLCYDILRGKIPYIFVLLLTIFINIVMENLKFAGIMKIIAPVAILIYPSFIVLSIANICNKTFGFKYIKTVVFITFATTCILQFFI